MIVSFFQCWGPIIIQGGSRRPVNPHGISVSTYWITPITWTCQDGGSYIDCIIEIRIQYLVAFLSSLLESVLLHANITMLGV